MTTTESNGRRAAILTRVSLDRAGDSASPERQEYHSRRLAEQKGWRVIKVFEDRDASGYDRRARRPGYEALKRAIEAGAVEAVVADSLSRIGRRAVGLWEFLELCQARGVEVVTVRENLDTTTAAGRLMVGFLASLAQWESELISERVRSHHRMAAEQGRMATGGSRQFGYKRDGTIVEGEAEVVREAAARIAGGESLRRIAFDLNARGVQTTMGKRWQSATLGQMMRSPRLAARRVHGGDVHEGAWEPILSDEEHALVLATLSRRALPSQRAVPRHLLTGLVVCGVCGGNLKTMGWRMRNGRTFARYQCVRQPGLVNCGGVAVAKDSLDAHVVDEVLDFLAGFGLSPLPDDRRRDDLEREVEEDKRALLELTQARFYERAIEQEEYAPARQALQDRLAANRSALAAMAARDQILGDMPRRGDRAALQAWWDGSTLEERRRALAHLLDCVRVNRAKHRGGNRFQTDRIEVVLSEAAYWRSVENEPEPFRSAHLAEREAGPEDERGALEDRSPTLGTYGPETSRGLRDP